MSSKYLAIDLIEKTQAYASTFKVGLEFLIKESSAIVQIIRGMGLQVFLDLKFHNIANTVKNTVISATSLGLR